MHPFWPSPPFPPPPRYRPVQHRTDVVEYLLRAASEGVAPGGSGPLVADVVRFGHQAGLTSLGLARRQGHPTSDVYPYMLEATRANRLVIIPQIRRH